MKTFKPTHAKAIAELLEASENAVYWGLRQAAADAEEGQHSPSVKPGYITRLQAAAKALRTELADKV